MLRGLTVPIAASFAVLTACSSDSNPVRDAVAAVGAGPTVARAPEFVVESRPTTLDYIPVGTAMPARPTPARTADEVKAAETELEAVRARNEAAAKAAGQAAPAPPAPVLLKTRPSRTP